MRGKRRKGQGARFQAKAQWSDDYTTKGALELVILLRGAASTALKFGRIMIHQRKKDSTEKIRNLTCIFCEGKVEKVGSINLEVQNFVELQSWH